MAHRLQAGTAFLHREAAPWAKITVRVGDWEQKDVVRVMDGVFGCEEDNCLIVSVPDSSYVGQAVTFYIDVHQAGLTFEFPSLSEPCIVESVELRFGGGAVPRTEAPLCAEGTGTPEDAPGTPAPATVAPPTAAPATAEPTAAPATAEPATPEPTQAPATAEPTPTATPVPPTATPRPTATPVPPTPTPRPTATPVPPAPTPTATRVPPTSTPTPTATPVPPSPSLLETDRIEGLAIALSGGLVLVAGVVVWVAARRRRE